MEHSGCHEKQCHEQEDYAEKQRQLHTVMQIASVQESPGEVYLSGEADDGRPSVKGVQRRNGQVFAVDLDRSLISRFVKPYDLETRIGKK